MHFFKNIKEKFKTELFFSKFMVPLRAQIYDYLTITIY
jgi:hypothetical protein